MNQVAEAYKTKEELISEIKKPGVVMVAAKLTDDDIIYIQAVKADLLHMLNESEQADGWIAYREGDTLYIG